LILYALATFLQLQFYVFLSVGIQATVFFLHGLPRRSEKYYDLSGSLTHFALVAASACASRVSGPRATLLGLLSVVWLARLGTFLFLRISRDGRDDRFAPIKQNWLSFMGAWTLQAAWVTLVQLPVLLLNSHEAAATLSLNAIDALALSLWLVGFYFEFVADLQKFSFRNKAANKDKFIKEGLWHYSRHPNYFGEILLWCAAALCVSCVGFRLSQPVLHMAWLSPAFTAFLLLCVSGVPMVEKAGLEKWGQNSDYQHYIANTSMLVPMPSRTMRISY